MNDENKLFSLPDIKFTGSKAKKKKKKNAL